MQTVALSVRMDENEVRQLDACAKQSGLDRSTLLKQLIRTGLKQFKLDQAVCAYRSKDASLSRAAEIAEMSSRDFLVRMESNGLEQNYVINEFEADLRGIKQ